jgi:hypothetical protein
MQFIGIFPKCFVHIRFADDLHHKAGGLSRCGTKSNKNTGSKKNRFVIGQPTKDVCFNNSMNFVIIKAASSEYYLPLATNQRTKFFYLSFSHS